MSFCVWIYGNSDKISNSGKNEKRTISNRENLQCWGIVRLKNRDEKEADLCCTVVLLFEMSISVAKKK
jgi:hypothetical protein